LPSGTQAQTAPVLISVVADYGAGDLAFAEVAQRLALHLPGADVVPVPVAPFDTLAAGFCVGQLALTDGPADRIVYVNVAPRADTEDPRPGNEGEELVAARLPGGVLVAGPNAGHTFSFVAPHAALQQVRIPETGSQFRSRDAFPALVARLAAGEEEILGPELPPGAVPDVPARTVAYVDGYGNLKTTWTSPPAEVGERVEVRVGGTGGWATVSDGTFAVPEGEVAFAPGSSGWPAPDGAEQRFYELFLRGASAAEHFACHTTGAPVEVRPA
jgi:S-adenosylmethionine hydrolase